MRSIIKQTHVRQIFDGQMMELDMSKVVDQLPADVAKRLATSFVPVTVYLEFHGGVTLADDGVLGNLFSGMTMDHFMNKVEPFLVFPRENTLPDTIARGDFAEVKLDRESNIWQSARVITIDYKDDSVEIVLLAAKDDRCVFHTVFLHQLRPKTQDQALVPIAPLVPAKEPAKKKTKK